MHCLKINSKSVTTIFFVLFFSFIFSPISLVAAEKDDELELIAGPQMFNVASKGAMLKLFTIKDLMTERAHQLKLSFFPQIVNNGLIVKFFTAEGSPLGKPVPLKAGRTALLDLEAGLSDLMVMIEENGKLEKAIRVFASVYRYKEGKVPGDLSDGKGQGKSGKKFVIPERLVENVDILEHAGSRKALDRALRALNLSKEEGEAFALAMENSSQYLAKGNFGAVNYFLKEAESICKCGEVYLSRAFVFGPIDIDVAIENIDKSIELFKNGITASVLLGKGDSNPEARACVIAANIHLQKAFGRGRVTPALEEELKTKFDAYLTRALEIDKFSAAKPVRILKQQWVIESSKKPQKGTSVPGQVEDSVRDFLKARELFVQNKYPEALDFIKKHPALPEADTMYLKAEILLNMGRREGARKALEKSVQLFVEGRCLAGKNGGPVEGTEGVVPPAIIRAALSRVSLARYWAEKFANEQSTGDKKIMADYIQTAITYMDEAIEAVPSHREWQLLVNTYRSAKLDFLYK